MPSRGSSRLAAFMRCLAVFIAALLAILCVPPRSAVAEEPPAVTVDLFAQLPYDWTNSTAGFNLLRIEQDSEENNAVFHADLAIPYDQIESLIDTKLKELVNGFDSDQPDGYSYKKSFKGGSIKVEFDFDAGFEFVTTKQPHFGAQSLEEVSLNQVRAILDGTSFKVWLTVDVATTSTLGELESTQDGNAELHATIGIDSSEVIRLYPDLNIKDFKLLLPVVSSNFDLEGVDDELSEVGSGLGAALPITGDPISSAVLFIAGLFIGKDEALAYANDKVADVITRELQKASGMVEKAVTQKLKFIDQAMEFKNQVMDQVQLPQLNMTANELLEKLDGEERLYTQVSGSTAKLLTNQRFEGTPAGVTLHGVVLIPRKQCVYGGNQMTGSFAYKLDDVNTDVTEGTPCNNLLRATMPVALPFGDAESPQAPASSGAKAPAHAVKPGLLDRLSSWWHGLFPQPLNPDVDPEHSMSLLTSAVYLGDDPAEFLETDHLKSWKPIGAFSTSGNAVIKEFSIECPLTISEMPSSAILEMRAAGTLADRLGAGAPNTPPLMVRLLLKKAGSEEQLLDHLGEPVPVKPSNYHGDPSFADATFAITGGVIPTDPMDCPHKGGGHKPDVDPGAFHRPGVTPDGVEIQGDLVAPMQQQQQQFGK